MNRLRRHIRWSGWGPALTVAVCVTLTDRVASAQTPASEAKDRSSAQPTKEGSAKPPPARPEKPQSPSKSQEVSRKALEQPDRGIKLPPTTSPSRAPGTPSATSQDPTRPNKPATTPIVPGTRVPDVPPAKPQETARPDTSPAVPSSLTGQAAEPDRKPKVTPGRPSDKPTPAGPSAAATAPSRLETALKQLEDPRTAVRLGALGTLARRPDPSAFESVVQSTQDKDANVSARATWALGEFRDTRALPLLTQRLESSTPIPAQVKKATALALGRIGDSRSAAPLEKIAVTPTEDPEVRASATRALGMLETQRQAPPVLRKLVDDPQPIVRATAAYAIVMTRDTESARSITRLLKDPDQNVRSAAVVAMTILPITFEQQLVDVFSGRSADAESRIAAATALSDLSRERLASEAIFPRLRQVLDAAEPVALQIAAIRLMAGIATPQAQSALRTFAANTNLQPEVRELLESLR